MAFNTVIGAVIDRFNSSQAYLDVSASGGLWFGQIPEEKDLPFVADYKEELTFTFYCYVVGLATLGSLVEKIQRAFDLPGTNQAKVAFDIVGTKAISCRRIHKQYGSEGVVTKDSERVYSCVLKYKLWTEHQLA